MTMHSFFKKLQREKLTPEEKTQIHAAIKEAQRQFPARVTQTTAATNWAFWRITPAFRWSMAAASIVIVLGASSGTALAAESALPGDILYPIKINVTEKVRGSVALSAESKALWEEQLAERRLAEMEKLNRLGRLTIEQRAKSTTQFTEHRDRMEDQIVKMEAKGKIEQANTLRVRLDAVSQIKTRKIEGLDLKLERKRDKIDGKIERKTETEEKIREPERSTTTPSTTVSTSARIEAKFRVKADDRSKKKDDRATNQNEQRNLVATTSTIRVILTR